MVDQQLTARYRTLYSAALIVGRGTDQNLEDLIKKTEGHMKALGFGDNYLEAVRERVETLHREVI